MYMKQLSEWLSTKVVKPLKYNLGFPDKPNYDEILEFLESQGFIIMEYNEPHGYLYDVIRYIAKNAKNSSAPLVFTTDETFSNNSSKKRHTWIRICNHGAISKDNPIFLLRLFRDDDSAVPVLSGSGLGIGTIEVNGVDRTEIKTYDEFVKLINKQFGWE